MMQQIATISKVLAAAGKRAGVDLQLSTEGTAALQLRSGIKLFFEYVDSTRRLYIYTHLISVPRDAARRLALYEAMLDCNFLNLGCETGALAIFRDEEEAVYQTGLDVTDLNDERLNKAIDALIDRREDIIFLLDEAKMEALKTVELHSAGNSTADRLATQWRKR
jgi:hypothetical protein